jgi:hypothetical protein
MSTRTPMRRSEMTLDGSLWGDAEYECASLTLIYEVAYLIQVREPLEFAFDELL